jgi:periplasmic protein TonB
MSFRCRAIGVIALFGVSASAAEHVAVLNSAPAIYAPAPKYPFLALIAHQEGAGMFVFRVDIKSGRVKNVIVAKSTGYKNLDGATVKALKQWKFKPEGVRSIRQIFPNSTDPLASEDGLVKVPVTFSIR